jgi:CRISPR-associated protein Cas5h
MPTTTSIILSYQIPPFTTIRGLISNALGLARDDFKLQELIKIGIRTYGDYNSMIEFAKMLKSISRDTKSMFKRKFPSSPMKQEFLIRPKYKIYAVGDGSIIEDINDSLQNPKRPLYLGQSDDFVDIDLLQISPVTKSKSHTIQSLVAGIHPNCEIVRIPYNFIQEKTTQIQYITLSIPNQYPLTLKKEIDCHTFPEGNVALY